MYNNWVVLVKQLPPLRLEPQTSGLQAGKLTKYTTGAAELTQHYVVVYK